MASVDKKMRIPTWGHPVQHKVSSPKFPESSREEREKSQSLLSLSLKLCNHFSTKMANKQNVKRFTTSSCLHSLHKPVLLLYDVSALLNTKQHKLFQSQDVCRKM